MNKKTNIIPTESTEDIVGFKSWDEVYDFAVNDLSCMELITGIQGFLLLVTSNLTCCFEFENRHGIKAVLKLQITVDGK